jgi:hypothetical protein
VFLPYVEQKPLYDQIGVKGPVDLAGALSETAAGTRPSFASTLIDV